MGKAPQTFTHDSAASVRREMRKEAETIEAQKSFDVSLCKDKPKGLNDRVVSKKP